MQLARITIGATLWLAAIPIGFGAAHAQSYPSRPITFLAGFAPGATSDLLARTVGERLSAAWNVPVVIDNRVGASGNTAAGFAARAPADGYTILVGVDAIMTSNVHLFRNLPFDPVKDFAPVTNAGTNTIVLAVHNDVPAKSVAELIAHAKANPGKLNYASAGVASPHHLAGELLAQMAGIQITHVPYKGSGAAVNDLVGGHIQSAFLSMSSAVPALSTGKIRLLGVVEKTRTPSMPDLPAIAETVPGFEMNSWLGFFVPAGTPEPIVKQLNQEMVRIIRSDAVKAKIATLGFAAAGSTPEELATMVKSGIEVRGQLIKAIGIQPE